MVFLENNFKSQIDKWIKGLTSQTLIYLKQVLGILTLTSEAKLSRPTEIALRVLKNKRIPDFAFIPILDGLSILGVLTILSKDFRNQKSPLIGFTYENFRDKDISIVVDRNKLKYLASSLKNSKVTNINRLINCSGLIYDSEKGLLQYQEGKKINYSPEKREIKFFLLLFKNQGKIVYYKDFARETKSSNYQLFSNQGKTPHGELKNKDFASEINFLRRDFEELTAKVGMPRKEFNKMVIGVRKAGYRLVCRKSS